MKLRSTPPLASSCFAVAAALAAASVAVATAQPSSRAVEQMREQVETLKREIAEFESANSEITRLVENISTAQTTVETLKSELPGLESETRDAEFLVGVYRAAFRVTSDLAPGENLGRLVLADGAVIEGAVYNGFEQGQVRISGVGGIVLVPPANLQSSLRSRFVFPPELPGLPASFDEIYRAKPDIAKTPEEVKRSDRMAAAEQEAAAVAEREGAIAQRQGETAQRIDEIEDRGESNEAILRRVRELQAEFYTVNGQRRALLEARSRHEVQNRLSRIKKAPAEMNRILEPYDVQIKELDAEESRLQTEIARLRALLR